MISLYSWNIVRSNWKVLLRSYTNLECYLDYKLIMIRLNVFGNVPNDRKFCPHLGLKWEQEFKLLGVMFDSTLENMECNMKKTLKR